MAPHPLIADLRDLRIARGVTRRQIADQVGVTKSAVQLWEAGWRIPSLLHLLAWAAALGASLTVTPRPSTKEKAA